jgi:hypothetical protein
MPTSSIIANRIRQRLWRRNRNYLITINGKPGTSKSYTALAWAVCINQKFDITHVVFSALEFMRLINSGLIKRGDVIVWEEIGREMGARDAMTKKNKEMGFVLQTFRNLNICLITTVPYTDLADLNATKLCDMIMETNYINYDKKTANVRLFEVKYNQRTKKFYYPHPVTALDNGEIAAIESADVDIPPEELRKAYEKKKKDYTTTVNLKAQKELEEQENPAPKQEKTYKSEHALIELRNGMKPKDISKKYDMPIESVYRLRSRV